MNSEVKEWLGIAPADFPVYFATVCLILMFFNKGFYGDLALSVLILFCTIVSCFIGMKKDSKVSSFTNLIKFIAYPFCLVFASFLIALNFIYWNS